MLAGLWILYSVSTSIYVSSTTYTVQCVIIHLCTLDYNDVQCVNIHLCNLDHVDSVSVSICVS